MLKAKTASFPATNSRQTDRDLPCRLFIGNGVSISRQEEVSGSQEKRSGTWPATRDFGTIYRKSSRTFALSAPHTHVSACTHKSRTEQLSIRVQATHRPGAVLMPTKGKVSSVTAKDSNKRSSSGGGVPAVLRGQHTVDDSCATRDDSDEPRPCVDQSAHHALDFGVVISR